MVSAQREIRFFFPNSLSLTAPLLRTAPPLLERFLTWHPVGVVEPIVDRQTARDYLTKHVTPTLTQALTALSKAKPADPVNWLADWLLEHNPNKPHVVEA